MMDLVARQMGRVLAVMEDAGAIMVLAGGQCQWCDHTPYRRRIWLYRHLRAKH